MAICSRRTLQRLINENAKFLRKGQTRNHVHKLNINDEAIIKGQNPRLDTEWEVILLNAFSKVGRVQHEQDFGGSRYPDLHFIASNEPTQFFVADITAISDIGFEGRNPYDAFWDELMKRVEACGLRPNSFSLRVEGNHNELYRGGPKASLKLPPKFKFNEKVFNLQFDEFLEHIKHSPSEPRVYRVIKTEEKIELVIGYDPSQRFASGSFLVYKKINHLTNNIIYDRLQEKRYQLLDSNFNGPLAIILCDGGFDLFNSKMHDFSSYSLADVIKRFLIDHPEINFILTCSVEQRTKTVLVGCWSTGFFDTHAKLLNCIDRLIEVFPEVETDPINAINHLRGRNPKHGSSHWGGWNMRPSNKFIEIKISARALAELLSGRVSQDEFLKHHGFIPSDFKTPPYINPFELGLSKGQLIDEISIEKSTTEDDDWITFTLRGPDVAISPFVPPQDSNLSNN